MDSMTTIAKVLLGAGGLLLASQLVLMLYALIRPREEARAPWKVTALCVFTPLVVIALTIAGVHQGRSELATMLEGVSPSEQAVVLTKCAGLCGSWTQQRLGMPLLALSGLIGMLCLGAWWRRRGPEGPLRRQVLTLTVGVGSALTLLGGGFVLYQQKMKSSFIAIARGDTEEMRSLFEASVRDAAPLLELTVLGAIGALLLMMVALLVSNLRAAKPQERRSRLGVAVALCTLVLGGLAFGLTRGHAADRHRELPRLAGHGNHSPRNLRLPGISGAEPIPRCPQIHVTRPVGDPSGGIVMLEHQEVSTARELLDQMQDSDHWSSIERLQREALKMKANWRLTNPDKPFPGEVSLLADRQATMGMLSRIFASVHAAGFRNVFLATEKRHTVRSRVMGRSIAKRLVGVRLVLEPAKGRKFAFDAKQDYQSFIKGLALGRGKTTARLLIGVPVAGEGAH